MGVTTFSDWSHDWLNDRELERRSWVHDPAPSHVDEVLMETSEAAANLEFRLFPGAFAIHRIEEKAR